MWRGPGTGLLPPSQRDSVGGGGTPLSPKENVRGFGWGRGKGHMQGAWGERGEIKTNRAGRRVTLLSQRPAGDMMREHYLEHYYLAL